MKSDPQRALLSDGVPVQIANSGLEVWLYDTAFREELKASGAFEEDAEESLFENAMMAFVRDGRIMAYQLMEDNGLDIVVSVRKPFTKQELAAGRWLAPQNAFISIPSGRLAVESNDSLTIRRSRPTDPGAELQVPPGNYRATLYRVDHDAMEAEDLEWEGPSEIVTLTKGNGAGPVRGQPALLPWVPTGPGKASWKIANGTYSGAICFHGSDVAFSVAIDPAGLSALGLQDRSVAMLSVPDLAFECVLVGVAGDKTKGDFYDRMGRLKPPLAQAGKEWAHCQLDLAPDAESIICVLQRPRTVPKKLENRWLAASLRLLEGRALEQGAGRAHN